MCDVLDDDTHWPSAGSSSVQPDERDLNDLKKAAKAERKAAEKAERQAERRREKEEKAKRRLEFEAAHALLPSPLDMKVLREIDRLGGRCSIVSLGHRLEWEKRRLSITVHNDDMGQYLRSRPRWYKVEGDYVSPVNDVAGSNGASNGSIGAMEGMPTDMPREYRQSRAGSSFSSSSKPGGWADSSAGATKPGYASDATRLLLSRCMKACSANGPTPLKTAAEAPRLTVGTTSSVAAWLENAAREKHTSTVPPPSTPRAATGKIMADLDKKLASPVSQKSTGTASQQSVQPFDWEAVSVERFDWETMRWVAHKFSEQSEQEKIVKMTDQDRWSGSSSESD
eukprot:gnl/TRDRNA2_/TRDRNA2_187890_c0_seq1.p1 gnl/TRDRNA2_/TRDRNA2_187890_c0~~gnl/TRDRNA2_/TRDRNA2_187890_c0_seq1.p1  ORF type:complete len:340 (-),score=60.38 gnl/TRDRNA2_/TRDRNA2_187890_c0_seq1:59-1078(-)